MSEPKQAEAVKLIAGILFTEKVLLPEVLELISGQYGVTDFISSLMPFSYTDYYNPEMGDDLKRCFVSFETLIRPESLPDVKLRTNEIEKMFSRADKRRVNMDPGYLSQAHLILATGKGYAHRPYLRDGIYADITLIYKGGSFQPMPWTYPDYGENKTRDLFGRIRGKYILQLRRNASSAHDG
jgi:hypothetical protein